MQVPYRWRRQCVHGRTKGRADVYQGAPKSFSRDDLPAPVTRDFCANCGTHLLTRSPNLPDAVILKVGSLDDPTEANPAIAIYTCDQLPFQTIPPGVASFEHLPT